MGSCGLQKGVIRRGLLWALEVAVIVEGVAKGQSCNKQNVEREAYRNTVLLKNIPATIALPHENQSARQ